MGCMRQAWCWYARRHVLQRRMRILTQLLSTASSPAEVCDGACGDAILVVLQHKIARAAALQGTGEARALLQDWLVLLVAAHNRRAGAQIGSVQHVRTRCVPSVSVRGAVPAHAPVYLGPVLCCRYFPVLA